MELDPGDIDPATLYGIAATTIAASLLLAWGFAWVERQALRLVNAGVAWLLG